VVVGAFEHRGHLIGDVAVARHHDCRPGACACQAASVVQNPLAVTTVGAAREEDDIRRACANLVRNDPRALIRAAIVHEEIPDAGDVPADEVLS